MVKKVIAKETLLVNPDFNEPFQIHMDASHYQTDSHQGANNIVPDALSMLNVSEEEFLLNPSTCPSGWNLAIS